MKRLINSNISAMYNTNTKKWDCEVSITELDIKTNLYNSINVSITNIEECDEMVTPYALMIAQGIKPNEKYTDTFIEENVEFTNEISY